MLPEAFQTVTADFPLEHVHRGAAVGNGYLGLSIWGGGDTLFITPGCSALWDHQGGTQWTPDQNYKDICSLLEKKDGEALKHLFTRPEIRPSLLPLCRIVLKVPALKNITLDLRDSSVTVRSERKTIVIRLSQKHKGLFAVRGADEFQILPSFDLTPALKDRGFAPPEKDAEGFIQNRPQDPPYGLHAHREDDGLFFRFFIGEDMPEKCSFAELEQENRAYWTAFWEKTPSARTGNDETDAFFVRGLFTFQCMTEPDGCAAGLQGPWIEDDRLPPWSGDYHFNINVEMCYWPACRTGLFENFKPLFHMLESWRETMRRNAKLFAGVPDGFMISHAVDDRASCVDAFWTGTIDQACAGWMAIMMYEYCRFSGDREFLNDFAFDFMYGTMRVYEAMLRFDGTHYELPYECSPEFNGSDVDACGKNPSFHLAVIQRLLHDLFEAAWNLGREIPARWQDIRFKLPRYTEIDRRIALWEGQDLTSSHRHHSHLAGICPFDCGGIPEEIIENSALHWVSQGIGAWTAWSFPWAVMLHNRFGNPEMADALIRDWLTFFVSPLARTAYLPQHGGLTAMRGNPDIMQMDSCMGMVAAIADCFLYEQQGVLELFRGIPASRAAYSCTGLPAPGGFRFSGSGERFSFSAERTGELKFHIPRGTWRDETENRVLQAGALCRLHLREGDVRTFARIS